MDDNQNNDQNLNPQPDLPDYMNSPQGSMPVQDLASQPGIPPASTTTQEPPTQTQPQPVDQSTTTPPITQSPESSFPPLAEPQQNTTPSTTPPPQDALNQGVNMQSSMDQQPQVLPVKKKRFSKVYLIVLLIFLVLGGLGFLLWKFWPSGLGFGKPGEIVWWGLWEDESIVQPLIEEYQNENPRVKVTYVKQSQQDYRERLTNALAKGEGPDIFRIHNTWVPMFKNELEPMPSSVMTAEEFSNTYFPVITSDVTSGSNILAIPLGYDALTMFINDEIFTQSQKTAPQTWDDFRVLATELTILDENDNIVQSGAAIGRTENIDHWPEILALMLVQNGVDLSKPTDQLTSDAIAFYTLFAKTDKIWNQTLPPSTISFANGKVAMYFGPSWRAFEIQQLNPDLKFSTANLPQLPKDNPQDPDIGYATYWVEGVWARSQNKESSWDFLKFISSKESLDKLYTNASKTRLFGEPFPRKDMVNILSDNKYIGSVVNIAENSKSWYLASRTFDGPTGINSQIIKYFEDAVNASLSGRFGDSNLNTLSRGVSQVLSQYGLITR